MGDFRDVPKEKIGQILEALKTVDLPAQKERSQNSPVGPPPYLDLSVSSRMIAAEKVYRIIKGDSDDFGPISTVCLVTTLIVKVSQLRLPTLVKEL